MKYLEQYKAFIKQSLHTGSRVICSPAPTDTDDDWCCLVDEAQIDTFQNRLADDGWELGGSFDPRNKQNDSQFRSWKKTEALSGDGFEVKGRGVDKKLEDTLNLILTTDEDFFESFSLATAVSKSLNLLDKHDRVTVFQAICQGNYPEEKPEGLKYGFKIQDDLVGVDRARFEAQMDPWLEPIQVPVEGGGQVFINQLGNIVPNPNQFWEAGWNAHQALAVEDNQVRG